MLHRAGWMKNRVTFAVKIKQMNGIKNIVLDLGGVLLNISFEKAAEAFRALGVDRFDEYYSKESADQLFEALETGAVSDADFLARMQQYCTPGTPAGAVEAAWNAILLDFRADSVRYLSELKPRYRLFLLSNTNRIHHAAFSRHFLETFGRPFDDEFEKAWYSHAIGRRKPYAETFRWALADAGLEAGETLFIDDAGVNVAGAQSVGMQTLLLEPGMRIESLGL